MPAFVVRVQACYKCRRVPMSDAQREVCKCGVLKPLQANPDVKDAEPVYVFWGWDDPLVSEIMRIVNGGEGV